MDFFVGKCLKISQKLHGGDRKHIKVCKKKQKSQNQQMSYFSPLCEIQLSIISKQACATCSLFCWRASQFHNSHIENPMVNILQVVARRGLRAQFNLATPTYEART